MIPWHSNTSRVVKKSLTKRAKKSDSNHTKEKSPMRLWKIQITFSRGKTQRTQQKRWHQSMKLKDEYFPKRRDNSSENRTNFDIFQGKKGNHRFFYCVRCRTYQQATQTLRAILLERFFEDNPIRICHRCFSISFFPISCWANNRKRSLLSLIFVCRFCYLALALSLMVNSNPHTLFAVLCYAKYQRN